LRVESPYIVVNNPGCFLIDFLVELLAAEERKITLGVKWPIYVDPDSGLNLVLSG